MEMCRIMYGLLVLSCLQGLVFGDDQGKGCSKSSDIGSTCEDSQTCVTINATTKEQGYNTACKAESDGLCQCLTISDVCEVTANGVTYFVHARSEEVQLPDVCDYYKCLKDEGDMKSTLYKEGKTDKCVRMAFTLKDKK